jgi:hypothetical protein
MFDMLHRVFTLLSALSAALCIVAIFVGLRRAIESGESRRRMRVATDMMERLQDRRINGEALTREFLEIQFTWWRRLAEAELDLSEDAATRVLIVQRHQSDMRNLMRGLGGCFAPSSAGAAQIARMKFYAADADAWVTKEQRRLSLTRLLMYASVQPICWLVERVVRRYVARQKPGLCHVCGYDLRGTPEKCPECGTKAAKVGRVCA